MKKTVIIIILLLFAVTSCFREKENLMAAQLQENPSGIGISTNPALVAEENQNPAPIVETGKLEYILQAEKPVCITVRYEKQVTEIRNGEVVVFAESGEQEVEFTENNLIWSITFEEDGKYEVYGIYKNEEGKEVETERVRFCLDHQAPFIAGIAYCNDEGPLVEKYGNIYSGSRVRLDFQVKDAMAGIAEQGVYATFCAPEDRTEETPVYYARGSGEDYYVVLPQEPSGFQGRVTLWAEDAVGNQNYLTSVPVIYSDHAPVVRLSCDSDIGKWTNQTLIFQTEISDEPAGIQEITYKIDGEKVHQVVFNEPVHTYAYELKITETIRKASGCPVTVEATNLCGQKTVLRKKVYIDKDAPALLLNGVEEGVHYSSNRTLTVTVEDISYEKTKTNLIIYRRTGENWELLPVVPFISKEERDMFTYSLTEEGIYKVCAVSVDAAGNVTKSRALSFVIDKTPPRISLAGIKADSMNKKGVALEIVCDEEFYKTAQVTVQVERTSDDKKVIREPEKIWMTDRHFVKTCRFDEDGVYQIAVTAADKVGNLAQEQRITFSVDRTKPIVKISGIGNYAQWDGEVTLQFAVTESFYQENTVKLSGRRTGLSGQTTELNLPFKMTGKNSALTHTFWEDGIYELNLYSKDKAGNASSEKIHFTIDSKAPQILNIRPLNGGYFKEFKLSDSLAGFFQDLTVISYRMLLNGIEYNGTDRITGEGKYSLYVMAEDAVGHISEEIIEFIVDHTPPEVVFSGVAPDAVVHDKGEVAIDLANREDQITAVRLNGLDLGADVRVVAYEEPGAYQIEVDCVDFAGNTCTKTLKFVYNKEDGIREKPDAGPVQYIGGLTLMIAGLAVLAVLFIRNRRKGGSS